MPNDEWNKLNAIASTQVPIKQIESREITFTPHVAEEIHINTGKIYPGIRNLAEKIPVNAIPVNAIQISIVPSDPKIEIGSGVGNDPDSGVIPPCYAASCMVEQGKPKPYKPRTR